MTDFTNNPPNENQTCPAVGYQSATVCVPVTVAPFAKNEFTITQCCGTPIVTPGEEPCGGVEEGTCVFTLSQDICVAVPVEFGAVATVGKAFVNCNGASTEECKDCK